MKNSRTHQGLTKCLIASRRSHLDHSSSEPHSQPLFLFLFAGVGTMELSARGAQPLCSLLTAISLQGAEGVPGGSLASWCVPLALSRSPVSASSGCHDKVDQTTDPKAPAIEVCSLRGPEARSLRSRCGLSWILPRPLSRARAHPRRSSPHLLCPVALSWGCQSCGSTAHSQDLIFLTLQAPSPNTILCGGTGS